MLNMLSLIIRRKKESINVETSLQNNNKIKYQPSPIKRHDNNLNIKNSCFDIFKKDNDNESKLCITHKAFKN